MERKIKISFVVIFILCLALLSGCVERNAKIVYPNHDSKAQLLRKNQKMGDIHQSEIYNKDQLAKVYSFYKKFLKDYILDGALDSEDSVAMSNFTPQFIKKMENIYLEEYDCEDGGCLAVWVFVTGSNDENPEINISNMRMFPIKKDWYKVKFGSSEINSYKIKIIKQGNKFKISDIINNNSL